MFQEVKNKELVKTDNILDALCKKHGYQDFEKWIAEYKKEFNGGQFGTIKFDHSENSDPTLIFNDTTERIITHLKGSYHLFRTDAEMREEMEALTFDGSDMRLAWQDDPEKMRYMEEMFGQKALMMHSQMTNVSYRNAYGGSKRMYLMTTVDRLMSLNIYMKMEIAACSTTSNVVTDQNYGKYLERLKESNADDRMLLDDEGYLVGNAINMLPMGYHGLTGDMGETNESHLPAEVRRECQTFTEKYMKKHKCSRKAAGEAFMALHPELWNNKAAWLRPLEDKEEEKERQERLKDIYTACLSLKDQDMAFFRDERFSDISQKELDAYKAKVEKELAKQGMGDLDENGVPIFFKILDEVNGGFQHMTPFEMVGTYLM